jgi:hypothetical protein
MDREFQISTLWQKLEYAKSDNPSKVCNGINDIRAVLSILNIDDAEIVDPLDTAFEVADVALGFGDDRLEGTYANQVRNLLDEFTLKIKGHLSA